MASADIDDERIGGGCRFGQWFSQPAVHGLPNEMFDNCPVRQRIHCNHTRSLLTLFERMSTKNLQNLSISIMLCPECNQPSANIASQSICKVLNLPDLRKLRNELARPFRRGGGPPRGWEHPARFGARMGALA